MKWAFVFLSFLIPSLSLAQDKILHLKCYTLGENPSTSFVGYIKGQFELNNDKIFVTGSPIERTRISIEDTSCRSWYESEPFIHPSASWTRRSRSWNAFLVKPKDASITAYCALGSILSEYGLGTLVAEEMTRNLIDRIEDSRFQLKRTHVSSPDCVVDEI